MRIIVGMTGASGAIFGRRSKPRSHWIYIAAGAVFETFVDPVACATLLELRSDGLPDRVDGGQLGSALLGFP